MIDYLRLLRPQQWIKNVFLFAGLIFSRQFYYTESIITSIFAFFIFSILSSGIYILNDIFDYEEDKLHPVKSKRPIAAGRIKRKTAWIISILLIIISLLLACLVNNPFFYTCLIYSGMMILYSLKVKQIIILDVLFVAIGYVLRAIAGAAAIRVEISSWLLLCTLLLALFLVVSKRRTEIVILGKDAMKHRKILSHYSIDLLNQMIAIVTSACIVSYCLYTLAPETVSKFHTRNLIFTVPFVIYGIFRYLYLTYRKHEADIPEKILITDLPLQICLILWMIVCILTLTRVLG
ncbi:decaprenyl-phosphate phosphoribosyltransferase [candidate division WOR-3 bacterium]|nr:decaprenyl-phosphate phosphoribosyltransferase [candidate division WOR-3 bacterium]